MQSQTETAHSQVEEHTQWQHQSCDDVEPLLAERTCVGVGGHYRIVVKISQNLCVLGVGQILYHILQCLYYVLYLLVVARTEEHVYRVRQSQQLVLLAIFLDFLAYIQQIVRVECVDWVLDYHLLAIDVAMCSQSEHSHEQLLVQVDVEHHRVVVCLVGKEAGDRCQHYC